tara:strand:- start:4 stop:3807 length:3804 start_codon:yes stop_codon:yes gene_type:complete
MPTKRFKNKEDNRVYTVDLPENYTQSDVNKAVELEKQKRAERRTERLKTSSSKTKTDDTTDSVESVTTQDGETTSPSIGKIAQGLTAEIAIASGGQVAGAATGLGYIPIAFASGYAGSAAAQEIEGREDFSYGRAISAGLINLIPFSNAAKAAKAAAAVSGKVLSKGQITQAVVSAEAKRGAAIGAGESAATSIIDTGTVDIGNIFTMAVGGSVLGGAIGRTGLGIKNIYGEKQAKQVFNKIQDKTPDEIDLMVANNEITVADIANASPSSGEEGLRAAKKISEEVKLGVKTKSQVDILNRIEVAQNQTSWQKTLNALSPSKVLGRETSDVVFYGKNIDVARKDVSTKIVSTLNRAIAKDATIEKHIDDYLADPKKVMPDRIKELPAVEGALRKFDSELKVMQKELTEQLDVYKIGNMSSKNRQALSTKIKNNPNYLTEEYQIFVDPDFVIDPAKVQRAKDTIAKSNEQKIHKEKLAKGVKNPNLQKTKDKAYQDASNTVDNIIKHSAKNLETEDGLRSASDTILKRKKDLSPELIDMMGSITSPVEKIRGTLNKVSTLVSNNTSDIKVMESLLRSGMAKRSKDIPQDQIGMYQPLNLRRDINNEKLLQEQVLVPKEIQEALNATYITGQQDKVNDFTRKWIFDTWNATVGISKAAKVIFNPPSYAVNAFGAGSTMIGMGMNPFSKKSYEGFKLALGEYESIRKIASGSTAESNETYLNLVQDMKKYGLASGNVDVGDLRSSVEKGGFIAEKANKIIDPVSKAYQSTDIAARFSVWHHNQKRLGKMFPGLKGDDLKMASAKLTNDTFQNYDKIPQSIRALSRVGGLPPFVAFTAEFSRNIYFQAKYAKQMIKGNFGQELGIDMTNANLVAMRREGLLRAGSLVALTGAAAGGISYYNSEQGVTPEMESAYDDVLARDYEKGKQKAFFDVDLENKTASAINPSYLVPHQMISEAFSLGFSERPMDSLGDFLSNNLVGGGNFPSVAIAQAAMNKDKYDRPIATNEDWYKNAYDKVSYVTREILRTGAEREISSAIEISTKGEDARYTTKELTLRQVGIRVQKQDWTKQATSNIKDVVGRLRANTQPYKYEVENNPNMLPQQKQDLYNQVNQKRKESFGVLIRNNKSLGALGFDEDSRIEIFKKSGVSSKDILGVLEGKYIDMDFEISKDTSDIYEDRFQGKSYVEIRKELNPLRKTDPVLYSKLVSKAKQERKNIGKDITGKEELIKNLSIKDRAKLVFESSPDERKRLQRLGVITADVRKEMRARGYK